MALGVKMNILLFAPGLLVLLVQYRGIKTTFRHIWDILLVQVSSEPFGDNLTVLAIAESVRLT